MCGCEEEEEGWGGGDAGFGFRRWRGHFFLLTKERGQV